MATSIIKPLPCEKAAGKKRNTVQRSMVFSSVAALANHPSADEVYAEVVRHYPDISRATVYRNLNVLSDEGKLRKIRVASAADRFDHNTHAHYHIKCSKCGFFGDVDMEYMHNLDDIVSKSTGYELNNHDIVFEGTCPSCKNR